MRKTKKPKSKFKTKVINQSIVCVVLIVAVMCINSVNKNPTNVFISNVKYNLHTSIDYQKTWDSIKEKVTALFNERTETDDKQETSATDSIGETP
ncbi:MAG: hypothetical protein J6V58_00200 [Clostridia bacterium]|nr:hypothetical protein [Clostridia bacterium]